MADSLIQLSPDSTGKKIDTRTESTNLEHRQVMVLGDPATNAGVAAVDATKGLAVDLTNTGANATAIKVDGSAATQPVSGTVTANAGTNLNTSALATSTNVTGGGQKSQIVDGAGNVIGATTNALDINIKSGNPTTITATQGTASSLKAQVVSGDATGSAVPANGYFLGGRATTTLPSAATAGNLVGVATDKFGRIITRSEGTRELVLPMTQLTLTATTTETTLVAGVASTFNDLLSLVVTNTSASASQVDFRDSTGGTIRMTLYVPAGDTRGISFATPLPQNTVNTAWTAKCGASVSSIIITGHYVANM